MAYSYSALATYKQCPAKYNYSYNEKLPRTYQHEAASRGDDIHKSVEAYLKGERDDLHIDIMDYLEFFSGIKEMGAVPEVAWGVTRDWTPCEFDCPDAMLRGYIDVDMPAKDFLALYELKTGKKYPEHRHQMLLYGLIKMLLNPDFDRVYVTNIYFDQKDLDEIVYHREMIETYKGAFMRQIDMIETDKVWMANPQFLCRYCSFSKENSGPCQF